MRAYRFPEVDDAPTPQGADLLLNLLKCTGALRYVFS